MSCTFCMTWSLSHGRLHLSKCTDVLMTAEGILAAVWPLLGHPSMGPGREEVLRHCAGAVQRRTLWMRSCKTARSSWR